MITIDSLPKETVLHPPRKQYPELSHSKNIDYFLEQLQITNTPEPVLVYLREMSISELHTCYRILPRSEAEELKQRNKRFDYVTINQFIVQRDAIMSGRYALNQDGLIIGEY